MAIERRYPVLGGRRYASQRVAAAVFAFPEWRNWTVGAKTYVIQSMNDVIVGDRLTDNKAEPDDYRFHDVFHMRMLCTWLVTCAAVTAQAETEE